MFLVRRPNDARIRDALAGQKKKPFSYSNAGIAELTGYTIDHNCIRLGDGQVKFQKALEAIKRWEMFNIGLRIRDRKRYSPGLVIRSLVRYKSDSPEIR